MILVQKPNPPLIAAGVGFLLDKFTGGVFHELGVTLFTASLLIWAYLELTAGVNWFRKLLGGVVLTLMLYNLYKFMR